KAAAGNPTQPRCRPSPSLPSGTRPATPPQLANSPTARPATRNDTSPIPPTGPQPDRRTQPVANVLVAAFRNEPTHPTAASGQSDSPHPTAAGAPEPPLLGCRHVCRIVPGRLRGRDQDAPLAAGRPAHSNLGTVQPLRDQSGAALR